MDCPFPGMDPFLENPNEWRTFHNRMISAIFDCLNQQLPPGFRARIEERCYLIPDSGKRVYPDVLVNRNRFATASKPQQQNNKGGVTVLERGAPTGVVLAQPEEVGEAFIEILATNEANRIITIIEVLSPTNKGLSKEGRQSYLEKQASVRQSSTHLLEIDLLRGGEHTVSVPSHYLESYGGFDYITCLYRSGTYRFEFWLSRVRDLLPEVRVPLTGEYADVLMPLQSLFVEVYRAGRFWETDYTKEPVPPLSEGDAKWAEALLKEKGFRP